MDFRLVQIIWEDSYGCGSNWMPVEGCAPSVMLCKSVGWLIYDGDDCKVIVPHMNQANHPNASLQGCGDMTIPSSAVRQIDDLFQAATPSASLSNATRVL